MGGGQAPAPSVAAVVGRVSAALSTAVEAVESAALTHARAHRDQKVWPGRACPVPVGRLLWSVGVSSSRATRPRTTRRGRANPSLRLRLGVCTSDERLLLLLAWEILAPGRGRRKPRTCGGGCRRDKLPWAASATSVRTRAPWPSAVPDPAAAPEAAVLCRNMLL